MTTRATVQLIEFESLLHAAKDRAGRAVRNLRQESGGFPSTTPGNGSPGGGKGGRATAHLAEIPGTRLAAPFVDVDPDGIDVPCTSVERQALGLAGRDIAAERLTELDRKARAAADGLGRAMHRVGMELLAPTDAVHAPDRMVVLAYSRAVRLRRVADKHDGPTWDAVVGDAVADAEPSVVAVFHLCQTWGYDPRRPAVARDRADLLAVDLTERWCTSHLRVGAKRERDRGELCQWCRKFEGAEGFLPPRELVQLHVDEGRVYDHQVAPFRQQHRDRQRNKAGAR